MCINVHRLILLIVVRLCSRILVRCRIILSLHTSLSICAATWGDKTASYRLLYHIRNKYTLHITVMDVQHMLPLSTNDTSGVCPGVRGLRERWTPVHFLFLRSQQNSFLRSAVIIFPFHLFPPASSLQIDHSAIPSPLMELSTNKSKIRCSWHTPLHHSHQHYSFPLLQSTLSFL